LNRRSRSAKLFAASGLGSMKDVPVVESRHQQDVRRQQHAVAEHVARHVADAGDGELGRLRVHAHLAEVPLHRLPGAARRDAHDLVVVAHRAAGGEGVAEPEAVFRADAVGIVAEGGRALVGRDHQVGVVLVVPHAPAAAAPIASPTQVVGDVEQPAQVVLVAGHAFAHEGIAVARGGCAFLSTKPPLEPTGTITVFFTICAFTRPSTSVRKVFRPVRPAQAAARHACRRAGARPRSASSRPRSRTSASAPAGRALSASRT
jgi:hypothetical protein